MKYLYFLCIIICFSCTSREQSVQTASFNKDIVQRITIRKWASDITYTLTPSLVDTLAQALDNAVFNNISKGSADFHFTMHFLNGDSSSMYTSGKYIHLLSGHCFKITDSTIFFNLWKSLAGLTASHNEYFPTFKDGAEYYQSRKVLKSEEIVRLLQVFSSHGHNCVVKDGILFYEGHISMPELAKYTLLALSDTIISPTQ